MLIFLKTIKSDNESDTTEPADDLCDPFAPTIISRKSEILFGLNGYSVVKKSHKRVDKKLYANDDFDDDSDLERQLVLFGEQEEHKELEIEHKTNENNSKKRLDEKVFFGNIQNCIVTINFN